MNQSLQIAMRVASLGVALSLLLAIALVLCDARLEPSPRTKRKHSTRRAVAARADSRGVCTVALARPNAVARLPLRTSNPRMHGAPAAAAEETDWAAQSAPCSAAESISREPAPKPVATLLANYSAALLDAVAAISSSNDERAAATVPNSAQELSSLEARPNASLAVAAPPRCSAASRTTITSAEAAAIQSAQRATMRVAIRAQSPDDAPRTETELPVAAHQPVAPALPPSPRPVAGEPSADALVQARPQAIARSPIPQQLSDKAQQLVDKAKRHYVKGEFPAAREALRKARRIDPYCRSGFLLEAQMARDQGQTNASIAALESAIAAYPESAHVQATAGMWLVQLGRIQRGLPALARAAELNPRSVEYAEQLATAYVGLHDYPAAEQALVRAAQANPGHATLPASIARLCEAGENYAGAEKYYTLALEHEPANRVWLRQRGRSRYRLGKYELACEDFAQCTHELHSPEPSVAMLEYGDASFRLQQRERADQIFAEIAKHSTQPTSPSALQSGLAELHRLNGMNSENIALTQHEAADPAVVVPAFGGEWTSAAER